MKWEDFVRTHVRKNMQYHGKEKDMIINQGGRQFGTKAFQEQVINDKNGIGQPYYEMYLELLKDYEIL